MSHAREGVVLGADDHFGSIGAGSRRECESFIEDGRVYVNGKLVTKMGFKVDPTRDKVTLDGERVKPEKKVYYLLNKPAGTICTNSDERGRPRVVDLIPDRTHRIYTVGRLDAESRGLILLTNDGGIANIICHWLANGRRVLVTSMRDPALAVLHDQLPEAIRPLVISLLASEQEGVQQFERSIEKIANEVQDGVKDTINEGFKQLNQEIRRQQQQQQQQPPIKNK